jgi:5-formyltetrahydrofolate cyclo-ligase
VGNEVPTGALIADARARGKSVFLPRAEDGWFFAWEDEAALVAGGTGVGEPPAFTPLPLAGVAGVAFVPLLAWDVDGGRLGRGGGWYDRVLPRLMMPIVGVAYDFQERARVPTEPWDVRLDYVVTESRLLHCGKVPSGRRLS